MIVNDLEAAEVFNKYFTSVFTLGELGIIPEPNQAFIDSYGKVNTNNVYQGEAGSIKEFFVNSKLD